MQNQNKKNLIEFREEFDEGGDFDCITIIVNKQQVGNISYSPIRDRVFWYARGINTLNLGINFESFKDAKDHCENVLNVLLNGAKPEMIIGKKLMDSISKERNRLAQNRQVPIDELKKLVFCAYNCGEINEDRASQLLGVEMIKFRELIQSWNIA